MERKNLRQKLKLMKEKRIGKHTDFLNSGSSKNYHQLKTIEKNSKKMEELYDEAGVENDEMILIAPNRSKPFRNNGTIHSK